MRTDHQKIILEFLCCNYIEIPFFFNEIGNWFIEKVSKEKLSEEKQVTLKSSDLPDEVVEIIVHYLIACMYKFYL